MIETSSARQPRDGVTAMVAALALVDGGTDEPCELLSMLGELEDLLAATAAAQARVTARFAQAYEAALTTPVRRGRTGAVAGVAPQVALARRLSPAQGERAVGFALAVTTDMPQTLAALAEGRLSARRAESIVRESSHLQPDDRAVVDRDVAGDPELGSWGDREVERRARAAACRQDPHGSLERAREALVRRRVGVRALPDSMCRLSGLLPLAQGVAAFTALRRDADTARAAGDPRSRDQIMADTLVERLTGQPRADAPPVEVQVVISDQALLATGPGADDPARLLGYGPVPAGWVRDLLLYGTDVTGGVGREADAAQVWLRRLYAAPDSGTLVAMDSRRRLFGAGLRRFLLTREDTCRTPWCDAPVRHLDHVRPRARHGPTSAENGQGLCVRCNHVKELPGWRAEPDGGGVRTTAPLGFTYRSTAPPVLLSQTVREYPSPIEVAIAYAHAA